MSVRRSLLILAILAIVIPLVVTLVSASQISNQQAEQAAFAEALQTHPVEMGRVERVVEALGSVEADEVVDLRFARSGRIADVFVKEGDYVDAGTPIAMLENESEIIAYEQALTNLTIAELRYLDTADVDEDDIRIAEAAVQSALGAYQAVQDRVTDEDIAAAELRYQETVEAFRAAEEARRNAGGLNREGIDMLDARIGEASFNMEIARLEVEELRNANEGELGAAYGRVVQAQRQLDQVRAGADEFDLARREVDILEAEASIDDAREAFDDTILLAPFAGYVSAMDVEVGQVVDPGTRIVEMTDVTPLVVEADIDEVDIRDVSVGMPARIEVDALDDQEFAATLDYVAPEGRDVGSVVNYEVEFTLIDQDPAIRAGMTADANVVLEIREDVLVVPNRFVRRDPRDETRGVVSLLEADGTLTEREVALGLRGDANTEIVSGLTVGETVAIDPDNVNNVTSFFGG